MNKYILSIDQGTTSTRAILFDKSSKPCFISQKEIHCLFPSPGWVECDANEIYESTLFVIKDVLSQAKINGEYIDSIGITNQRETTIIWDKNSGKPIYNAIIWQSKQSCYVCEALGEYKDLIQKKTGLLINPYFSASKIRFILDKVDGAQEKADKGELLFGTIDCWLIYKLTNGQVHATDVSNASRTLLCNINDLSWDSELTKLFNIPKIMLPKICPSSYLFGYAEIDNIKVPIAGVAGDQQAALFGQTCFDMGDCKNTYGTGCFMLMNIGNKPIFSNNGLLTTVAWKINNQVTYALEGSVFMGGASVQWLRDGMNLITKASESEGLATSINDSDGVYVVPAFAGLGTPYWDSEARGTIFGLTRGSNKATIVRATIEGIAYQCKDVFEVMSNETNMKLKSLNVDGGATANNYLLQFQSDILSININVPTCLETTALGVAYLAGLETGYYKDINEIKKYHTYSRFFTPKMDIKEVNHRYEGWKLAVKATRVFKYDKKVN